MRTGAVPGSRYDDVVTGQRKRQRSKQQQILGEQFDVAAIVGQLSEPPGEQPDIAAFGGAVWKTADFIRAAIERLAHLSRLDYERARIGEAKRLGIQRLKVLDDERDAARKRLKLDDDGDEDDKIPGHAVTYEEPEPWPEPVDGAELLDELARQGPRFVVMPQHAPEIGALWITHSYCLDATDVTPRLAIKSVFKGSGKSTYFDFLEQLVYRPDQSGSISMSAFFRSVDKDRPCILIDDFDSFVKQDSDIRNVLNTGHHIRGRVKRNVLVGDHYEVRVFRTFAAVAYNHIGDLPPGFDTLTDRSITLSLLKRLPDEKIESISGPRRRNEFADLRRKLKRWADDHLEELTNAEPAIPAALFNRGADNWRLLFAITDAVGGKWPQKARDIALASIKSDDAVDASTLGTLLRDIYGIFAIKPIPIAVGEHGEEIPLISREIDKKDGRCVGHFISTADLIGELVKLEGHPWGEFWRGEKPITDHKLARLLKPLGIRPCHNVAKTDRGYYCEAFLDAFNRYLRLPSPL